MILSAAHQFILTIGSLLTHCSCFALLFSSLRRYADHFEVDVTITDGGETGATTYLILVEEMQEK